MLFAIKTSWLSITTVSPDLLILWNAQRKNKRVGFFVLYEIQRKIGLTPPMIISCLQYENPYVRHFQLKDPNQK